MQHLQVSTEFTGFTSTKVLSLLALLVQNDADHTGVLMQQLQVLSLLYLY